MADSPSPARKTMAESATGPKKPHAVIPVREVGLVLYPDDQAVGLQFQDGGDKQVFLRLPGSLSSPLGRRLSEVVTDNPRTATWEARILKLN
jgi:hypothetical protein